MRRAVEIGSRVESVAYRKADGSKWVHRFSRRAALRGNPDGSLSVRPARRGTRLHKEFPFEGRKEPFMINPPRRRRARKARRNPALQILNPPRRRRRAKRNPWYETRKRMTVHDHYAAPRHRKAALLGINRRKSRSFTAKKYAAMTAAEESPMAKRRKSRRRRYGAAAHNPPHRRRRFARRSRRNPPMRLGGFQVGQVVQDAVGVGAGVVIPQLALRMDPLSKFADTPLKRGVAKAGVGIGLAMVAKKFFGGRAAGMVIAGTVSNILLADVLPKAVPQLGLGMADAYDSEQFPTFGEMETPMLEGGEYGGVLEGGYMRDPSLSELTELTDEDYG